MANKSTEELKALIVKFYALNPTDEQIEIFYTNEILPHDKRSIVEIMGNHWLTRNGLECHNCHIDITGFKTEDVESWPQCTSIWVTYFNDKELPEGFEHTTYKNDACPSIGHESGRLIVWFHDKDTWEEVGWKHPLVKYQVVAHHRKIIYGEILDDSVDTDTNDWNEVLKAIETWRKTARTKVEVKSPDSGEYLSLFAFKEWGAYQAVSTLCDEPELYYAPMNKDGTPDTENIGITEFFDDSDEVNFLEKINDFFGTAFTINNFPSMKDENSCDSCGEYIDDHLPEINCPNEKEGE